MTGGAQPPFMLAPSLLVIEELPSGTFLFRFTTEARLVGDTWHESIDAAKEQASFEFEDGVSEWRVVPADVTDAASFGLTHLG